MIICPAGWNSISSKSGRIIILENFLDLFYVVIWVAANL